VTTDPTEKYGTKYTYFYVPNLPVESQDGIDLGAFFRLGGYSDLEENAFSVEKDERHYYPAQYIEDQGGVSDTKIYTNAAGSDPSTSNGILLACDGRILVKSRESMYTHTGDQHNQVDGNYELDASGTVKIAADDTVEVSSGTGKTLTLNAGTNADKSGNLVINANEKKENFANTSTTNIWGHSYTVTKGNTYTVTEGLTNQFFLGLNVQWSAGSLITLSGSVSLQYFTGLIKVYFPFEVVLAGVRFQAAGAHLKTANLRVNTHQIEVNAAAAAVEQAAARLETNATFIENVAARVGNSGVSAANDELVVDSGVVRSSVRAMTAVL